MKAVLTLLVLAALIWFLWPGLRRVIRDFGGPAASGKSPGARPDGPRQPRIEADDLAKCAACGTWVPVTQSVPCERADCPQRAKVAR
jgi:hypothetical protein